MNVFSCFKLLYFSVYYFNDLVLHSKYYLHYHLIYLINLKLFINLTLTNYNSYLKITFLNFLQFFFLHLIYLFQFIWLNYHSVVRYFVLINLFFFLNKEFSYYFSYSFFFTDFESLNFSNTLKVLKYSQMNTSKVPKLFLNYINLVDIK